MQTAKLLAFLLFMIAPFAADARVLHYGDYSVELSAEKHTTPALHVQIGDELVFGAMFTDTAPENSLRISFNNTNYWVGPWCAAGTYRVSGSNECTPCGIGHYCTGGSHRAACTGGAIACPGANHGADAVADAALMNRDLTQDEVETHIPATTLDQWQLLGCGGAKGNATYADYDTLNDVANSSLQVSLGVGTYMFLRRYTDSRYIPGTLISPFTGTHELGSAQIAIFDHPVGARAVGGAGIFHIVIDTNNAPFQSWTLAIPALSGTPNGWHAMNENRTNIKITGDDLPIEGAGLCIYQLK